MAFVAGSAIESALPRLHGTAGHLLKIWLVLKHMGLAPAAPPLELDTGNSTPSLERLFGCGAPDGRFFVPFAHTRRYTTMAHDASRSIIQTTAQRWASSGSVVTCDPTGFLDFDNENDRLVVRCGRQYPLGLGHGENGFALEDGTRVAVPELPFAVWFGRTQEIPDDVDAKEFLLECLRSQLNLSAEERDLIFVRADLDVALAPAPLSDQDLYQICSPFIDGTVAPVAEHLREDYQHYARRVRSMNAELDRPAWLRSSPDQEVESLLDGGSTAILLYGPPRTGKTRKIDMLWPRGDPDRESIQIHDGWTYDNLVEGFMPTDGEWDWHDGPLKRAISDGKSTIVLEEINRTQFTQALGEVFSLIESHYRGEDNAIRLRSGKPFWIPSTTRIIMTMNTVDKSTEEIDDALLGRIAAVEFPPLPAALSEPGEPALH